MSVVKQGVARDRVARRGNFYFKLCMVDKNTYHFLISRTHDATLWARSDNIQEENALNFMRWMADCNECMYASHILSANQLGVYNRTFPDDECDAPESVPSGYNYPQDSDDEMPESTFLDMIYE